MTRLRRDRRHPRLAVAIFTGALVAFQAIGLVGAQTASAAVFTGGFSPKIFSGGADLNGDGVVTGRDDSQDFFGETDIIDGKLDCNAWGTAAGDENDGTAGDLVINASDDCSLVAYDGTSDGVTITVTDGAFGWPIGTALPTVYNAANPDSPGVHAADFAWSTILGKVDSNGNEVIDDDDCTFGLIGQTVDVGLGDPTDGADILGSDPLCGFAVAPASTLDGLVDLNSDVAITSADTCTNGCFFGHNVTLGLVQVEGSTSAPTITSFSPTSGPVGATVTINGTNFTGATSVKFNGVSATFIVNSATKITATVPTGATTGRISVTTPGGTATSTSDFTVTTAHLRSITLSLRRHLVARGVVSVEAGGPTTCVASVPVKIQRRSGGSWKTVGKTTTNDTGAYRKRIRDRAGRYRSVAPLITVGTDTCNRAVSNVVRRRR
jgi:IPT/TIG domain